MWRRRNTTRQIVKQAIGVPALLEFPELVAKSLCQTEEMAKNLRYAITGAGYIALVDKGANRLIYLREWERWSSSAIELDAVLGEDQELWPMLWPEFKEEIARYERGEHRRV